MFLGGIYCVYWPVSMWNARRSCDNSGQFGTFFGLLLAWGGNSRFFCGDSPYILSWFRVAGGVRRQYAVLLDAVKDITCCLSHWWCCSIHRLRVKGCQDRFGLSAWLQPRGALYCATWYKAEKKIPSFTVRSVFRRFFMSVSLSIQTVWPECLTSTLEGLRSVGC